MTQIRILGDTVSSTEAFNKLSKVNKIITLQRNNISAIEHGVNLLKNVGLEVFEKEHNFSYNNKLIIFELANI